ncbi:MAG: 2-amino-4-hydroxy-6-hydroxymethyldihydropteridine diphosphokinase [Bacteroidales bacterium]|nr:2-amino-4-hydroxy-6-hydroxymethyldihydropteridine diphosphokinase [Bacteroidales bacterium]
MSKVYLLLGGNLGDVENTFERALQETNNRCGKVVNFSSIYETEPWGFFSDSKFLNQVIVVETEMDPNEVLIHILQIEKDLGRVRYSKQYTSRVIDIDILFYDQLIIDEPQLEIPHPKFQERNFAIIPMMEIDQEFIHPISKKNISELRKECDDKLQVSFYLHKSLLPELHEIS